VIFGSAVLSDVMSMAPFFRVIDVMIEWAWLISTRL
jgi:hypothetical protein